MPCTCASASAEKREQAPARARALRRTSGASRDPSRSDAYAAGILVRSARVMRMSVDAGRYGRVRKAEAARAQCRALGGFANSGIARLAGPHGRKLGRTGAASEGQRVDHRGDEHVAGDAADEIEVDRERAGEAATLVRRRRGRHTVLRG